MHPHEILLKKSFFSLKCSYFRLLYGHLFFIQSFIFYTVIYLFSVIYFYRVIYLLYSYLFV